MNRQKGIPAELAYVLGILFIALGAAVMEKADFGMSMIVAPAYLTYRFLNMHFPFVTFGMAEYCLQGVLLIALALVLRRFKRAWIFTFVTAVIYGFVLDGCMLLVAPIDGSILWVRAALFILGMFLGAMGVSFMFHTYLMPETYELFVKEIAGSFRIEITRVKTVYDVVSCTAAVIMSFLIFGLWRFEGVKWGTIVCALINGRIIGWFSNLCEQRFGFYDALPWRPFFEDR